MSEVMLSSESDLRVCVVLKSGKILTSPWFKKEDDFLEEDAYNKFIKDRNINPKNIEYWYISVHKNKDVMYISKHAMQRIKERCGWSKKAALRMVKKVYLEGSRANNTKGYLGTWLKRKEANSNHNDEYVIYGNGCYIFNSGTLITVLPLPSKEYVLGGK